MNKNVVIVVNSKKLVAFLQDFGFSFADVCKIMRNKDVRVNGVVQKADTNLCVGDEVVFYWSDGMLKKKYDLIFDGVCSMIIYKHAGIETTGKYGLEGVLKAIAVHRLDRNTEGLMVFAKDERTANKLKSAFKTGKVHKHYIAEVVGSFQTDKTYNAFLVKDSENSFVKISQDSKSGGVPISTKIKTVKAGSESSLVEVDLLTGKTHQIRAHLAFLGYPIIGDGKYGKNEINKKFQQKRQKLACFLLKFDFLDVEELNFQTFKKLPNWIDETLL